MIKTYCNKCKKEIIDPDFYAYRLRIDKPTIEEFDNTQLYFEDELHLCRECMRDFGIFLNDQFKGESNER